MITALESGEPCEVPRKHMANVMETLDKMKRIRVVVEIDDDWIKLSPY